MDLTQPPEHQAWRAATLAMENTTVTSSWAGTHTFSSTLLIDSYASYFHLPIYRTPQNVNTKAKDLEQVIQANTAVTKVLPKHTIKAGFSYLWDNH